MVITFLEAEVSYDKASRLENSFNEAIKNLDKGIVETFLLQNQKELSQWRIVTVWENFEALNEMKKRESTPKGVSLFREVDAEPRLSVFKVIIHSAAKT